MPASRKRTANQMTDASYLVLPSAGQGRGVLVLHAWWGLNDFFKGFCDRLAREGYVTLAPDLYHGKIASTIKEAERLRSKLNSAEAGKQIMQAAKQLQSHPAVTNPAIGAIGFSLGGYYALWLAEKMPATIAAIVTFYGTRGGTFFKSHAPVLGHFAERDVYEPLRSVQRLEERLRAATRKAELYTYPGTTHWFFEEDRPDAFNAPAAQLAWTRTSEFLDQHIG